VSTTKQQSRPLPISNVTSTEQKLRPHQALALDKLSNGKILCGGVGSGKTKVAIAYYLKQEAPRDIIVITTAKKRDSLDWDTEAVRYGIGTRRDATTAGVLTVDSWNNLGKYRDRRGCFFIFDEQRLVGAGDWSKSFLQIVQANRWILLTATPGDTWLDYIPVFIANGFFKNRTEFKREHVVYNSFSKFPKVDRYVGVGKLLRLRHSLLVEMPYERHTTRIHKDVLVSHDEQAFERVLKGRWNVFENRPLRDVGELYSVMRKVANSSPSRIDKVSTLIRRHPKLIVFYNFDYELEALRSLAKTLTNDHAKGMSTSASEKGATTSPVFAEWNGHKHQPIPSTDSWVYLVQYTAGAEGWNCTETDAMVFYSLNYSYKIYEQAQGRIDRLDTPFVNLYYYTLMSTSLIDKLVKKALISKQNFNEGRNRSFDTDLVAA